MIKQGMQKRWLVGSVLSMSVLLTAACGTSSNSSSSNGTETQASLADIEANAKKEGSVISVGMPDSWANWKDTWEEIQTKYSLTHEDTDMSSAEEIAKFDAEKDKPTADIGDIGIAFGTVAVAKGVTQPYKPAHFDEIPDWAKDKDGNWVVGYQGTIAFLTNKNLVPNPPKSWEDLKNGNYKIVVGDVTKAAQAQMSILAATIAFGGNESDIEKGVAYFEDLAKAGRLSNAEASVANIEKGEIPVTILWDFNALSYRDQINKDQFEVTIPKEGSVVSGYATIINKYAPHPNAAKLTREYIFSDQGQINLAKGYARPIRSDVKLPDDVAAKLLPADEYKNAKPVGDYKVWEQTTKTLPQLWQERVLVHMS